jgi:hypothetical protein
VKRVLDTTGVGNSVLTLILCALGILLLQTPRGALLMVTWCYQRESISKCCKSVRFLVQVLEWCQ